MIHGTHHDDEVERTVFEIGILEDVLHDVSRFVDPGCVSPEEGVRTVPVDPDEERFATIWMMNVLVPLDIIFLDDSGQVVEMVADICERSKKAATNQVFSIFPPGLG